MKFKRSREIDNILFREEDYTLKGRCVSCDTPIPQKWVSFLEHGNYCAACCAKCERLGLLRNREGARELMRNLFYGT